MIHDMPELRDLFPEALIMDGFNSCIIGVCSRINQPDIVAYDYDKVIATLMKMGMSEGEAVEFHEFNQAGAWMGETTPCFVHRLCENEPDACPDSKKKRKAKKKPAKSWRKS